MSSRWFSLIFIFLVLFLVRAFLYEPFRLPSVSMYPSIDQGAFIIVNKYGYGNYEAYDVSVHKASPTSVVNRGDVVVFKYPKDMSISYIKRVIGIPGDTIIYKNKKLIINGNELVLKKLYDNEEYEVYEESIGNAAYKIAISPDRKSHNAEYVVPEGRYFVMGDNRDNSNDSRYWGFVPESNIVGDVVYIF